MGDSTGVCAGACCSVFPLHKDYDWLKDPKTRDQRFIADMVIPLTRRQAVARTKRLGYPALPKYGKDYNHYTCRHWDETTRLCTVYEDRPNLCRDYPYVGRGECERGCGYCLSQADTSAIAERDDETWEWSIEDQGWKPRSNSNFLWDPERGVLKAVPTVSPATKP